MEHCIQPFLDECDINHDGLISDYEWGVALDLEEGSIIFYIYNSSSELSELAYFVVRRT